MRPYLLKITVPLAAVVFLALPATAQVRVGERAPLVSSVDENLHPLSMADMAAGAPLE